MAKLNSTIVQGNLRVIGAEYASALYSGETARLVRGDLSGWSGATSDDVVLEAPNGKVFLGADNGVYYGSSEIATQQWVQQQGYSNTWRPIAVGGTTKLSDTSTTINFAGSGGTSVSYSGGTITISTGTIPSSLPANGGNADTVDNKHASDFLLLSGGTMTGVLTLKGEQYYSTNSVYGMNANNSDIMNLNSIYTADSADSTGEGIRFYRRADHWDSFTASGGVMYFMPDDVKSGSAFSNAYVVLHSGNIGSYAQTSAPGNGTLTIKRNGTTVATFTANSSSDVTADITDSDANTWRPIAVGGTTKLSDSSTTLNFAGSGTTSVSYSSGTITISSSDQYTGTVTSVGAGTGLSISGTASVNPTVNVASGYKLPTTTEWNNKADSSSLSSYLPKSAGSGNALTGDLYLGGHNIYASSAFLDSIILADAATDNYEYSIYGDSSTGHLTFQIGDVSDHEEFVLQHTSGWTGGIIATQSWVTSQNYLTSVPSHASSSSTYGLGTTSNYGHCKISNIEITKLTASSDGVAAGLGHSHNYIKYLTSAPTSNNVTGQLTFVILSSEPSTKYDGYVYFITGS